MLDIAIPLRRSFPSMMSLDHSFPGHVHRASREGLRRDSGRTEEGGLVGSTWRWKVLDGYPDAHSSLPEPSCHHIHLLS